MKHRILFVSTSSNLALAARKLSKEMRLDLHIYEGGIMRDGHIYAKNNQSQYDVIISQGGTAKAIKSLVNIPVVAIEIRTVDFIKALYEASTYGGKIGLIIFRSESIIDLESLKDILNIDFTVFPYSNKEEYSEQLNKAIGLGVSTLVGLGDCLLGNTKEYNLNTIVVRSGEKQLKEALVTAKNICDLGKREEERDERIKMN